VIKLIMTWDIKAGREPEYLEFIMREFGPSMVKLGLQPTDAWYTVFGRGPQVLAAGVTDELQQMRDILTSVEWRELEAKLLPYVENYQRRIVEAVDGFQM
jgi:hypothetical protein